MAAGPSQKQTPGDMELPRVSLLCKGSVESFKPTLIVGMQTNGQNLHVLFLFIFMPNK